MISDKRKTLAHWRSVYGITTQTVNRMGGWDHLRTLPEETLAIMFNQSRSHGFPKPPKRYYKLYTERFSVKKDMSGEKNNYAKLTWESVRKIRQIYYNEMPTYQSLANRFSVSRSSIRDIVNLKSWIER